MKQREVLNKICDEIEQISNNVLSASYSIGSNNILDLCIEYISPIETADISVTNYIMKAISYVNKSDIFRDSKYELYKDDDKDVLTYRLTFRTKYDYVKESIIPSSIIHSSIIRDNINDNSVKSDKNVINHYTNGNGNDRYEVVSYTDMFNQEYFVSGDVNIIRENNFFSDSEISHEEIKELLNNFFAYNHTQVFDSIVRKSIKSNAKKLDMYTVPDIHIKCNLYVDIDHRRLGKETIFHHLSRSKIKLSDLSTVEDYRLMYINPKNRIPVDKFTDMLYAILDDIMSKYDVTLITGDGTFKSHTVKFDISNIRNNREELTKYLSSNSSHIFYIYVKKNIYNEIYGAYITLNENKK